MSHPGREHGGPDAQGGAAHDFSTNANACGPCPAARDAVAAADATRYPDPTYTALRAALGRLHGVGPQRIVPAGSASEFIFRITAWARACGVGQVQLPRHGYGDYAAAARAWSLQPVDEAASAGEGAARLVWHCDPSSPLGQADHGDPRGLAPGSTVVLDRAYEPLRLTGHAPPQALLERCWQVWSPNKALGLTGVRAAYAIAPVNAQAAVQQLEALAPSWLLGAHGVAMLTAWCEPAAQAWLQSSLPQLRAWKERQAALCASLGWIVLPSDANFFTCRAEVSPMRLAALRAHGIRLRDCSSFGLPGHLRLGVLPPASQDALRDAWEATA